MPSKLHTEAEAFFKDPHHNFTYPEDFLLDYQDANGSLTRQTPLDDDSLYHFQMIVRGLNIFGTPIIILVGCIGNTLSFVVFSCTHLRFQSASMYLAFLNLVDTLFLLCVLVMWFGRLGINLINQNGVCQTVVYMSYVTSFLSVYTVVSFTAERWIIVYKPLKKSTWCTRKRALIVISSLLIGALLLYSFAIWTTAIVQPPFNPSLPGSCMSDPKFEQLDRILTTIDTIITLITPSIVIIVLNIGVTYKIWQFVYKRNMGKTLLAEEASFIQYPIKGSFIEKKNTQGTTSGVQLLRKQPSLNRHSVGSLQSRSVLGRYLNQTACTRNHMQLRTTRALLIVSSVFVVLNFPSHVFRSHVFITHLKEKRYVFPRHVLLWQHIFQILYYTNFAVNFFLYSACSRTFRSALKRLYEKMKRRCRTGWTKMKTNVLSRHTNDPKREF